MKLKAMLFALLLVGSTFLAPVNTLADPPPGATLTCIKAQSDVALHLRFTNTGPQTVPKGAQIAYAYKITAGGAPVNGSFTLENALPVGQSATRLVIPQASWTTNIHQCTAVVQVYQPANPKR
jgi:hypothetical protein